ncbi:MAG: ABC transporter permease [Phototrophicaceae bacterium]
MTSDATKIKNLYPKQSRSQRFLQDAWKLIVSLLSNPLSLLAVIVLAVILIAAIAAPTIAPHDPELQSLRLRLKPPFWMAGSEAGYLFGTDALGRDMLSRMIYGSQISLIVGISTVLLQGVLGVLIGLLSGYFGGWVDNILMRIADIQQSIPFLILAVALAAVVRPSLINIIFVLGITGWVTYSRVVRGQVLSIREREFVEASRALGSGNARIIFKHILPNIVPSITVIATLTISTMILAEASLSFLGMGVPPPTATLGGMVADGRNYISTSWWVSVLPGIQIFITVLSINLIGDHLREILDPTLRNTS